MIVSGELFSQCTHQTLPHEPLVFRESCIRSYDVVEVAKLHYTQHDAFPIYMNLKKKRKTKLHYTQHDAFPIYMNLNKKKSSSIIHSTNMNIKNPSKSVLRLTTRFFKLVLVAQSLKQTTRDPGTFNLLDSLCMN